MASSSASTSSKPKRECFGRASCMILQDVFTICRKSNEDVLKWFRRDGIIGDFQDYGCPSCGRSGNMRVTKDSSYSKDTMVWKCSNRNTIAWHQDNVQLLEKLTNRRKDEYIYDTVNQSIDLVNSETGEHTQTIESTWRAVKRSLPRSGTTKDHYNSYFAEFIFCRQYLAHSEDRLTAFFKETMEVYRPSFP
uniref:ISXO2-like transposase domain-containing protein n=1 Tax=Amphimedon queenslandica TaxID=400682 RepID=A0A1X7U7N3_AMPQE